MKRILGEKRWSGSVRKSMAILALASGLTIPAYAESCDNMIGDLTTWLKSPDNHVYATVASHFPGISSDGEVTYSEKIGLKLGIGGLATYVPGRQYFSDRRWFLPGDPLTDYPFDPNRTD